MESETSYSIHPGVVLQPTYWSSQLGGVSEQEGAGQALTALPAALPLGPDDPAERVGLEVSAVGKDRVWSFCQPRGKTHNAVPWDSGARPRHLQQRIIHLLRNSVRNSALVPAEPVTMRHPGTVPLEPLSSAGAARSDGPSRRPLEDGRGAFGTEAEQGQRA